MSGRGRAFQVARADKKATTRPPKRTSITPEEASKGSDGADQLNPGDDLRLYGMSHTLSSDMVLFDSNFCMLHPKVLE